MDKTLCVIAAALLLGDARASDLFLPVAGQVRAASGKEFHTTLWVTNLASRRTSVQATFLERHPLKVAPATATFDLGPAETKEISDLPVLLRRVNTIGAIRFQSAERIGVTARIFSGAPPAQTTGATLTAVPWDDALRKLDEGFLSGVTYDGSDFRYTTYLVETAGRPAGVLIRLLDSRGRELQHDSFLIEPYEQRSLSIEELARGTRVRNATVFIRVTGGGGRVYAVGQQIPLGSGDGSFFEMHIRRSNEGFGLSWGEVLVYSLAALAVIAAVALEFYRRKRPLSG